MAEEIINKNVVGVGFGFYSGAEIKRLSVKRITVPFAYDALNNAIPNGFYDPSLGATKNFET
jgi:DNA-directed RNA polymerase I subunit RPA1